MSECWVCEMGWIAVIANAKGGMSQPLCEKHMPEFVDRVKNGPPLEYIQGHRAGWEQGIAEAAKMAEHWKGSDHPLIDDIRALTYPTPATKRETTDNG